MDIPAIHRETGAFWDEIADTYSHGEGCEAEVIEFLRSGGNYLLESEQQLLGDLAPWCRRAIHLQCSGGLDALSLLRQGAAEVVGVDISEGLLASARRKAAAIDAPAAWYCSDLLQTPTVLNGTADLVYTGKGALCWMMDLAAWADVVARVLAPGGRVFILEGHPLDWIWDKNAPGYLLDQEHGNYFSTELRERLFSRVTQATPRYRQWTLGEVVNSVINAGLVLDQLHEYPEPFWDQFPHIPHDTLRRLPHTFALLAHKP
ncbi:methyltransferase [Capsulimonas corticalis]|uniref:Methyltransferase n=1 Tax=Capsulimonas corticalis TaxID=2219043 RepID=A0A402CX83_9BACT|nr:class I SAM-dependent methyltransferase [Capsulimonas corticalis]BDI32378.1 methyltransferase [Capsulimonas corticalis]